MDQLVYNPHVVNEIVENDLCVRCGACKPACPVNIIEFDKLAYPYITQEEDCVQNCVRCLKVCPGEKVDYTKFDDQMFDMHPHPESITGITRQIMVGSSTDIKIRKGGTSGGFITQLLLYMLDQNLIDGALVLGSTNGSEGWQQEPFIARTPKDLIRATKSKYMLIPHLEQLKEIEAVEGNYAVVGLPCHIHSLRKYQKVSKKLRQRIKVVIGLLCNVAFEPYVFDELCEYNGVDKKDVTGLHFRYGSWPGGIVAEFKDGSAKKVLKLEEMKDEFNMLKVFYTPTRCNMCTDFSAEYADISVGDPWLRGPDGKYLFPDDQSTVVIRTETGEDLVRKAVSDGYINVKPISRKTFMVNFEKAARYKRDFVPKFIMFRKLLGLSYPKYNRPIGHGSSLNLVSTSFKIMLHGMSKFKWFRMLGLYMAQTRMGIAFFAWNRKRKEAKFATSYPKAESFVAKLSPSRNNFSESK